MADARPPVRPARVRPRDLVLTLVLYLWFTLGYLLTVLPVLLVAAVRLRGAARRQRHQAAVSRYLARFFRLVTALGGGATITVPDDVRALRGSVLVCNHQSYLDALLLVATFERHCTVVKPTWLRVPLFGWLLRHLGYLGPAGPGGPGPDLADRVDDLRAHLAGGGVLFLFPEGHRSRDGSVGPFQLGAFKLARSLGVDVELLRISGAAALFPPGCFWLRTGAAPAVRLEPLGRISAAALAQAASLRALAQEVEERYRRADGAPAAPDAPRPPPPSGSG